MKNKPRVNYIAIMALLITLTFVVPIVYAGNLSGMSAPPVGSEYKTQYTLDALKIEQQRSHEKSIPYNWSGIPPSLPVDNGQIISIAIPSKLIKNCEDSQNPNLSLNASDFNYLIGKNKGKELIFKNINPSESVSLLRVPESILSYINNDPKKVIIHFPIDHFKKYDNLDALTGALEAIPMPIGRNSSNVEGNVTYMPNSGSTSDALLARWHWYASRAYYNVPEDHSIIWISGKINPEIYTNSGSDYLIWHEREIFLNGYDDTVEFIAEYNDAPLNTVRLYCAIYDGGPNPTYKGYVQVPRNTMPHQYDYYFIMGKRGLGEYEMWFYDPLAPPGQEWYAYFYTDSTPSTHIKQISGSSELELDWDSSNYYFQARTSPISDEWNLDVNDNWFKPSQLYEFAGDRTDPYTGIWEMFDQYGTLQTYLLCDSP